MALTVVGHASNLPIRVLWDLKGQRRDRVLGLKAEQV